MGGRFAHRRGVGDDILTQVGRRSEPERARMNLALLANSDLRPVRVLMTVPGQLKVPHRASPPYLGVIVP